jgi:hypothetical protein
MGVTTLFTIDEFYENPVEVRKFALTAGYPKPHDGATYPGRNSEKSFYPEWMDDKISNIVGEPVELSPGQMNGGFRISLSGDTYKQDIHTDMFHVDDPNDHNLYAGVLYLSDPKDCIGKNGELVSGTKLWRHKELGWERVPLTPEEGAKFGFTSYSQIHDQVIEGDGVDRSKWYETADVKMAFNRMAIFRPWMFHSAGVNDGFGDNLLNGRLVQIFFWRRKR